MSTKTIGVKQFRENFTELWKKAIEENIRFVVLWHSEPILEVKPFKRKDKMEKLKQNIVTARKQAKAGKVRSLRSVMNDYGIL